MKVFKTLTISVLALVLASGCTIHRINEPGRDSTVNLNCQLLLDGDNNVITDANGKPMQNCSDTATGAAGSSAVAAVKQSEQSTIAQIEVAKAQAEVQKAGYQAYAEYLSRKQGVKKSGFIRINKPKKDDEKSSSPLGKFVSGDGN